MRDASAPQGIAEPHHVLLAAEEDRSGRGLAAAATLGADAREPLRDVIRLGVEVAVERELDRAVRGAGPRAQCIDGHGRRCRERREHRIGRGEHGGAVAPARQQREPGAGRLGGERRREAAQIARARAAPAVDRLMRVAHRHDGGVSEERGEQIGLRDRGVLVLVEQHDPEPVAQLGGDRVVAAHDLQCAGDLVGVVEHAPAPLRRRVFTGEPREQRQRRDVGLGIRHILVDDDPLAVRGPVEHVREPFGERGELIEVDQVVDSVAGDPQGGVDDAAQRLTAGLEPRVVGGEDHPPHEQPGRGLRQHRGLGIPPDPHGMLADDLIGEAVVGRHGGAVQQPVRVVLTRGRRRADVRRERVERCETLGLVAVPLDAGEHVEAARGMQCGQMRQQAAPLELRETLQAALDPLRELTRGLAREGEPQHLVPADDPVRDQPHDASGHRLGLAAARTGHHEGGCERRFDDRGLLGGGRELAEGGGDRRGGQGHEALTAATVWMRQRPYEYSSRQCSSYGARNAVPRITPTASRMRPKKAARRSSSNGGCHGVA